MPLTHHAHTVYTRALWNADWTARPYLYAETLSFSVSPEIPQARLSYRTGEILQPDELAYASFGQLDLAGHYVKIAIDQQQIEGEDPVPTRDWHGIVVESEHDRQGHELPAQNVTGRQTITAAGLEFLLERQIVDTSVVRQTELTEERIARGIGFNLGPGDNGSHRFQGNLSASLAPGGTPVFAERLTGEDVLTWTGYEILFYLLKYHSPRDFMGTAKIDWWVGGQYDNLKSYEPAIHVHGLSVRAILNRLIDRRRALGWRLQVLGNNKIGLRIFSFNENDIVTPGGVTVFANPVQVAWELDDRSTVQRLLVTTSASHVVEQVIARSTEWRTTCFTVTDGDPLVADWTIALADTYDDGATTIGAEYTNADIETKQQLNRAARNTEELRRVYRHFRVGDWDEQIGGEPVLPDDDGNAEPTWRPGLVFADVLPLLSDHDYSADPLTPDAVVDNTPTGAAAEYLRPFAVLASAAGDGSHFDQLDRMAGGDVADNLETEGRTWSTSLRMQDEGLGLIIDVNGAPQHAIAVDDFTAADAADTADWKGDLDWRDIYFTVALRGDSCPEGRWPAEPVPSGADVHRTLVIEVPGARLDYVVPGTILGLDNEGHKIEAAGGIVRDDRPRLRELARIAYDWYSTPRVAIAVTDHTLDSPMELGELVTVIGGDAGVVTVNSVVTRMTYDLVAGTTHVETQFADLDVMRL